MTGPSAAQLADEPKRQDEHVTDPPSAGCRQLAERLERVQPADVAPSLDLTDQIDQGSERDRVPADVHTATEIQLCASASCRLEEQRGLTDAWVTADQHDPWLTLGGSRHGALKHRQLVVASDDRVVTVTASHRFRSIPRRRNLLSAARNLRGAADALAPHPESV